VRSMKSAFRLAVERLEDRWCPALTATLRSGTLLISGSADNGAISIVQDSTTAGTINVTDGSTAVSGAPFTGVNNIRLNLTDADDKVTIDLGGQTLSGSVTASLGDGANDLSVVNGTIGGRLAVNAGNGDDTVTLGDGTKSLSVKDVSLGLFGGMDTVDVKSAVDITRSLTTIYANDVTLDAGSTANNINIFGGSAGNTVTVAGDVTGTLYVNSFFFFGSDAGTSLTVSGDVDGNLIFVGSNQDDTLDVTGSVGRSLAASTLGGADNVTVGGAVTNSLSLDTGAGDDQVTLSNAVGGRTFVSAGAGDDTLTISSGAKLGDNAVVSMGAGNDTVTLDDAATFTNLFVNGGTGTDTLIGTTTKPGLTLVSF